MIAATCSYKREVYQLVLADDGSIDESRTSDQLLDLFDQERGTRVGGSVVHGEVVIDDSDPLSTLRSLRALTKITHLTPDAQAILDEDAEPLPDRATP
jgi:hypothetical protein